MQNLLWYIENQGDFSLLAPIIHVDKEHDITYVNYDRLSKWLEYLTPLMTLIECLIHDYSGTKYIQYYYDNNVRDPILVWNEDTCHYSDYAEKMDNLPIIQTG